MATEVEEKKKVLKEPIPDGDVSLVTLLGKNIGSAKEKQVLNLLDRNPNDAYATIYFFTKFGEKKVRINLTEKKTKQYWVDIFAQLYKPKVGAFEIICIFNATDDAGAAITLLKDRLEPKINITFVEADMNAEKMYTFVKQYLLEKSSYDVATQIMTIGETKINNVVVACDTVITGKIHIKEVASCHVENLATVHAEIGKT